MTRNHCTAIVLAIVVSVPSFAHGEQIVVFPLSFALLLVLAVVIMAVPWHKWWARLLAAITLLGANVAVAFSPIVPGTVGELAAANLNAVLLKLLVIPMAIAILAIAVLARVAGPAK